MLESVCLRPEICDERKWPLGDEGKFTVKSMFSAISRGGLNKLFLISNRFGGREPQIR
ncbi:hypothetical protein Sjap_012433 [Stephania japonica]|uniref:Uncharacterized protein n=1 Tax=Stephania japonica TaxID=461633 RepID=A0AAP0P0C4_9MAGN